MNETIVASGSAFAIAVIAIATQLPKLMAALKRDKLDGKIAETQKDMVDGMHDSYERQLKTLADRITTLDSRITKMMDVIHNQQVKLTRLQTLVIQLNGLLVANGIKLPNYMQEELRELVESEGELRATKHKPESDTDTLIDSVIV